jgi:serine/threonine-protein kinase
MSTTVPDAAPTATELRIVSLALDHGWLSREQVLVALRAWTKSTGRPLTWVLLNGGWLNAAQIEQLEHDLKQINLALIPGASAERFVIQRELARGGLGTVSVARDVELNRDVALKQILPRKADSHTSKTRFAREAEITGQLEHPGIVPVYGFGMDASGRPYYAMRLIRGTSLHQAIERYHAGKPDQRRFRELLQRFIAVCNTVAFAHSKGVIHRDLKPENVMLGEFGETLVVDWGLAKATGRAEEPVLPRDQADDSFVNGDSQLTLAGSSVGTPAYMSPEQAYGGSELTPATDVYSLGTTLYELLVGRPAFNGDPVRVMAAVYRSQFPRPRQVKRTVPLALEAICLKAMQHQTARRYESALALAVDVERYLADEPVSAYRSPWSARLARWSRRHRPWVVGGMVLLVSAVVALAVVLAAVQTEKQRTDQAHQKTQKALDSEQQSIQETRKALDELTSEVIGEFLYAQTELTDAQKEFLPRVLRMYTVFASGTSDAPETREALAQATARIGRIQLRLGNLTEAERALTTASNHWQALQKLAPHPEVIQHELAQLQLAQAECQRLQNRLAEARATFGQASNTLGELAATQRFPNAASDQAEAEINQAGLCLHLGQPGAAEQHLRAALAICQRHTTPAFIRQQAKSHVLLGETLLQMGKHSLAIEQLHLASERWEHVAQQSNLDWRQVDGAAVARSQLGLALHQAGQSAAGEKLLQAVSKTLTDLRQRYPALPALRRHLAQTQTNLGVLFLETRRVNEAETAHNAALDLRKKLVQELPHVPEITSELAQTHGNLALVYRAKQLAPIAIESLQEAVKLLDKLVAEQREVLEYQVALARTWFNLGGTHLDVNAFVEAEQALQTAAQRYEQVVRLAPQAQQYRHEWTSTEIQLGRLARIVGRYEVALQYYDRCIERLTAVPPDQRSGAVRDYLRTAYYGRAQTYVQFDYSFDALADYRAWIELLPTKQQVSPRLERIGLLLVLNRGQEAFAELQTMSASPLEGDQAWWAVRQFARCLALVPDLPDANAELERWLNLAVNKGVAPGLGRVLRSNPDFDSVRPLPAFQALLRQLPPS